jgi:WhiB family transcriptional regulator, redox-sensing transcriptional regulator
MTSSHTEDHSDGARRRSGVSQTGTAGWARLLGSDWVDEAACSPDNGDSFFAEARADVATALLTCAACPVKNECLTFALSNDERYGIWGGTTPDQRRRLVRTSARLTADARGSGDAPPAA